MNLIVWLGLESERANMLKYAPKGFTMVIFLISIIIFRILVSKLR